MTAAAAVLHLGLPALALSQPSSFPSQSHLAALIEPLPVVEFVLPDRQSPEGLMRRAVEVVVLPKTVPLLGLEAPRLVVFLLPPALPFL
tara:strand:- start:10908 stop:11174 length:267 start_codon:yes stop_codon:yes gene_type:complete